MKKLINPGSVLLLFWVLAVIGCNPKSRTDNEKPLTDSLIFEDLDTAFIYSLNDYELQDSLKIVSFGRGKTWRMWKKLHKNCQNSEIANNMLFFGPSNTLGMGTILTIDEEEKSINADFPLLQDSLNESQKKIVFNNGRASICEFNTETNTNVEFLVSSKINAAVNASLQSQIENAKSIQAKIDSWQVNNLYIGGLSTVMKDTTRSYFKNYMDRIKKGNRYIITKEILINGFSATIQTKNKISAELKAQLEDGIVDKLGDTEAMVKYSYAGETTIKMTTQGTFIVFCEVKRAKIITD